MNDLFYIMSPDNTFGHRIQCFKSGKSESSKKYNKKIYYILFMCDNFDCLWSS